MPHDSAAAADGPVLRLGEAHPGDRGVILEVRTPPAGSTGGVDPAELELRLLEFGFVEGARVEVLHEGLLGGDPIAVKVDDMRVALRRGEAMNVILAPEAV
jgi:ferrous iron transport protein A